ncbi:MAG TPA: redoxin domain-containing protein [Deltaproteobacteria bacterium]|nr:redoxin domain-containing protein [Deltaproteobacteria bacterium]
MVKVGDKLSDFTLKDQNGKDFNLSAYTGRKILLSFHPLAWTSLCARQMQSLEDNHDAFTEKNTVAVGLSVDSTPCKKAWAKELKIEQTRLLADFWPHGGLATTLGIFREKDGVSERANIIVDENGTVIFAKVYPISELPDIKEILAALS